MFFTNTGYKLINDRARFVDAPGAKLVLQCLGSFGVSDLNCVTVHELKSRLRTGMKTPILSFVDLEPVFVKVVEDFYTAGDDKLYKKFDVRDELSCAVVRAAQSYSDEVAQAWTDAGFTVV